MGDLSNTISTVSALLFLASTALNIYLTMRLSKFENQINAHILKEVEKSEDATDERIKDLKADLERMILREADIINKRIDRINNH